MCDKWGISKYKVDIPYEFRFEFAVQIFDEVDFDRRLNLTERTLKFEFFYNLYCYF